MPAWRSQTTSAVAARAIVVRSTRNMLRGCQRAAAITQHGFDAEAFLRGAARTVGGLALRRNGRRARELLKARHAARLVKNRVAAPHPTTTHPNGSGPAASAPDREPAAAQPGSPGSGPNRAGAPRTPPRKRHKVLETALRAGHHSRSPHSQDSPPAKADSARRRIPCTTSATRSASSRSGGTAQPATPNGTSHTTCTTAPASRPHLRASGFLPSEGRTVGATCAAQKLGGNTPEPKNP